MFSAKQFFCLMGLMVLFSQASHAQQKLDEIKGLSAPKCVLWSSELQCCLVSNVNGLPQARDRNGFISLIETNGTIRDLKYIESGKRGAVLDAPKGMCIIEKHLFVADIESIRVFQLPAGSAVGNFGLGGLGAKFLNGLAHDGKGNLIASDTSGNMLFRIPVEIPVDLNEKVQGKLWVRNANLGGPNAIFYDSTENSVLVGSFMAGGLWTLDSSGNTSRLISSAMTGIDGIQKDSNGTLYVSNYNDGSIYKIVNGRLVSFIQGLTTPSEFLCHDDLMVIPEFEADRVSIYSAKAN